MFATFKQSDGLVCEAQNEELTEWRTVGRLGGTASIAAAEEGVAGECPNVFKLQGRYVLIRSTYPISYLLGDFDPDAVTFTADGPPRVLDYGYGGDVQPALHSRGLYGTTASSTRPAIRRKPFCQAAMRRLARTAGTGAPSWPAG